ncbi:hypothetical protein J6V85_00870 [Candidatus Saccharibacteria bacterium]|nr:hypothetical protein [Candidatus Saccharibacteria bacterium]
MDEDKQTFKIPSFGKKPAYNFEATDESFKIYQELNSISEEIERCRSRNC